MPQPDRISRRGITVTATRSRQEPIRDQPINEPTPTAAVLNWFDRRRGWLWLALGLIYAIGFNGQWRVGPDSAIHVSIARSLAQGDGFIHPTGLQDTVNPGLAYLTAATFRLFGVDQFFAIDAVMLLCSAVVLVLTFWVVRLRFDRPTAVLVVCMLGVNETFYRYGYQALTDMPFLLGLMLLLLGIELVHRHGARVWIGAGLIVLSIGVMAAFRSVVLTVLIAGVLMAVTQATRGTGWARYAVATTLAACVLIAVRWLMGGGALMRDEWRVLGQITETPFADTLARVFLVNGPTLLTEHLPEAIFGVDFGSVLSLPLGIAAIVVGLSLFRVRPLWGLLVAVFIVQWIVFITTERYVLVLMPLLALGWWRIGLWAEARVKPDTTRYILATLLALWFAPNLVRIGTFIVEQRSQPFLAHYDDGRYAAMKRVVDELTDNARAGDFLIANHAPQLTYYTQLPVYGPTTLPTFGPSRKDTVQRIRNAKRILMVSPLDGKLNERVKQLKLKQVRVLSIVPTPQYDRQVEYKIIEMRMRSIDWAEYKRKRELRLSPGDSGDSKRPTAETPGGGVETSGGAAEQSDGQPDQQPRESEQPSDQTP
jgi:Dolichyl-phosphate-mannose-protein mannosyltransferase